MPSGAERAVAFAHQLTDGHLGGLQLVLRAMTRERNHVEAKHLDLRRLLERPVDHDDLPLAEEILRLVLGSWQDTIRPVLLRASAARDLGDIALARVLRHEPARAQQLMHEFRSRDTWVRHPPAMGDAGQPTLHPFARRAALHRLANSRTPDEPTWTEVHQRLSQLAADEGHTTSAMYHSLAMGEVGEVANTLSELFRQQYTRTWFQTLSVVTQAPLENPARRENSEHHYQWLAKQANEGHLVSAELVSALQLHSDPLGDPNHDLCSVIAHTLEALADHAPEGGLVFLLTQAENFRACHACHHGGVRT